MISNKKKDIYIGIDPDKEKSGLAIYKPGEKTILLASLSFPFLLERIKAEFEQAGKEGKELVVIIEASWRIKPNWHLMPNDSKGVIAAKGHAVGENHMTGKLIQEMLDHYCMTTEARLPLKKCWRGKDGKITHEELTHQLQANRIESNKPGRTNQEERDAALLAIIDTVPLLELKMSTGTYKSAAKSAFLTREATKCKRRPITRNREKDVTWAEFWENKQKLARKRK